MLMIGFDEYDDGNYHLLLGRYTDKGLVLEIETKVSGELLSELLDMYNGYCQYTRSIHVSGGERG